MNRLALLLALLCLGCDESLTVHGADAAVHAADAAGQEPDDAGLSSEPDAGPACGDGVCVEGTESCEGCAEDCGQCAVPAVCGDGSCDDASESCASCAADCGACSGCGDGTCDPDTETCYECAADCGACPVRSVCGDGACVAGDGEDCSSCAVDCGACPHCGDGACRAAEAESCASCPADCGACDPCGDDVCDGPSETCATCPADCGRCESCGDGVCQEAKEDCTRCPADCGACGARPGCVQGQFSAFHGNLHSHTAYSDGQLTPGEAFEHAQQAGLDFQWVTDHMGQMQPGQFQACRDQANTRNKAGVFVAGCGYEWVIEDLAGKAIGHFNLLFVNQRIAKPKGLEALYADVAACAPCVGQWNHPPWPGTFGGYRYYPTGKSAMQLIEFSGRGTWAEKLDAYFLALQNGWRVSPSMNEDNHSKNWGDTPRATGVWAAELTRAGLREAIAARRTFATEDDTATLSFKADKGCWMGSVLRRTGPLEFTVVAKDRQGGDGFKRIELLGTNGKPLETRACNGANPCTAKFSRSPNAARFWVAQAVQSDGDRLLSAPIWLEP